MLEFNLPPQKIEDFVDETGRDVDILRRRVYKKQDLPQVECTLEEELQPPPYRKNVQQLIKDARKLDKPKFEYNTGLDYYPFQK